MRYSIQKGQIRNQVLKQISVLKESVSVLEEASGLKSDEIKEYEENDPGKASKLKRQVRIIQEAISSIRKSVKVLEKYRNTKVTYQYPNPKE